MSNEKRKLAMLMASIILVSTLSGCGSEKQDSQASGDLASPTATISLVQPEVTPIPANETASVISEDTTATLVDFSNAESELDLTEQQKNSFSMLYYLAITAEDIRISKDNRLMLDDIYTTLLNDINPGAIDETTQEHLKNLRDIIKSYLSISVKRDRLQYIYNQDKAASIRSAVPNPLAILSMTNALDWKSLATSVVFTVVDSYTNYKNASAAADREFLMSGWELDDEETAAIQKNRERAFDYMVDIVQEYNLDGQMTLSEEAIETFAEICEIEIVQQRIRRLVSEEKTYALLGNYWLELADCYFETDQYEECLRCVFKYNELSTGIYRMDYNYVQILPKAIVAAQAYYAQDKKAYVSNVGMLADDILNNTTTKEWAVRYFAAQVYLDLYRVSGEQKYLDTAYNIAYDNITILVDEQRAINETYLTEVQELTAVEPDYRFMTEQDKKDAEAEYKEEKKRVKSYNSAQKEARKTELPPLYEPLILNCDLLFALANEIGISQADKSDIQAILETASNGVFLAAPINNRYSFMDQQVNATIDLTKSKMVIPVNLLAAGAKVTVTVAEGETVTTFDDCIVTEVERKGPTIDTFFAHITSKQMSEYSWTADSKVTVFISNGDESNPLSFNFKVSEYNDRWVIADKVVFESE